jgi:hypothetical protein
MNKNRRAFTLEDMSQQGGIITATVKEHGVKKGEKITFSTEHDEVIQCVVINKVGHQVKLRVEKIAVKK